MQHYSDILKQCSMTNNSISELLLYISSLAEPPALLTDVSFYKVDASGKWNIVTFTLPPSCSKKQWPSFKLQMQICWFVKLFSNSLRDKYGSWQSLFGIRNTQSIGYKYLTLLPANIFLVSRFCSGSVKVDVHILGVHYVNTDTSLT